MLFIAAGASDPQNWLPAVVGIIVAILGGGGIAALIKSRPEGSKILIDAAAGVVLVQTGVITDLRKQLDETKEDLNLARDQIDELRTHVSEMSLLRVENDRLKIRVNDQEREIQRLQQRVVELERHNS